MILDKTKGIQIAYLIREVYSKLNQSIEREFKDTGLTVPQIMIIQLLSKNEELKVSQISSMMSLTNSTVSGIIDRLEKNDMVNRCRSQEDRRIVYIELTEKGKGLIEDFRDVINTYFDKVFKDASDQELDTILNGIDTLKHVLDDKLS